MRHTAILVVGLTGCRAIFGVEEAPERPDATSIVASTSVGGAGSSTTGPTASTGEGASSGQGGVGGAGDAGGTGETTQGSGGVGGGGDCSACGGVLCCLGACEGDVCGARTFDLGAEAMRLADVGDRVAAIVVREGQGAGLQWIPKDAVGTLPVRCLAATGEGTGLGYVVGHDGDAYYSRHTPLGATGSSAVIVRIQESCLAESFSPFMKFAGLAVRGGDLLAVRREPESGSVVACLPFGVGSCPGATSTEPIADGLDVALDGATIVWSVVLEGGAGAILTEGGPTAMLPEGQVPIALEVIAPSVRWALANNGAAAIIFDSDEGPKCEFGATGPLGFAATGDHVFLPHRDGLMICDLAFSSCVLDAAPPVRDVLATPEAIYFSAGETVVRIQRPLDAYIESLPSATPCVDRR